MGGKCLIQMEVVFGLPYPVHYIYHTIFDRQANLVPQHHLPGEEGTATPALPAPDEESLPPPSHPDHLLQTPYRESADQLRLRLVCKASDWKSLQRVVRTAERIMGSPLTSIGDIGQKRCLTRAHLL